MSEKLDNIMLAHIDGIYRFSAREDCDELVGLLINELLLSRARIAKLTAPPSEGEIEQVAEEADIAYYEAKAAITRWLEMRA